MGQMTNGKSKKEVKEEIKKEEIQDEEDEQEQEQDGVSVHSPCKINSSSLRKEKSEVDLELRLLEALEIYPPSKLRGVHRHFVLYGLTEYMRRSFNRPFTADDVLKLVVRFYNLEMVKPDDEDAEFLSHEEDFHLPQSFFADEEN
ncbi:hypothetical protein SASPL_107831 [Salvia splendens]|uniref:Chromatin modification-related protein EAF7 n=1 Tax=Salvia splendens TaxID=180675 RepID=A0A8X9A628_SALSN|nr:uncharacterized protein LOC121794883 [Salvia splendens]KAG6429778.1 hypothetical protein SASPL_107831 [Salvia splendens]